MAAMLIALVALVGTVSAVPAPDFSYIRSGKCLNVAATHELNYQKFSGSWVEEASRPNVFRRARQCVNLHFVVTEDLPLRITTGLDRDNRLSEVVTELRPLQAPSAFTVEIQGFANSELVVADTDYSNYACVYQCQQVNPQEKVEWAFVYRRAGVGAGAATKRCAKVLAAHGFDSQSLVASPHPENTCNASQ